MRVLTILTKYLLCEFRNKSQLVPFHERSQIVGIHNVTIEIRSALIKLTPKHNTKTNNTCTHNQIPAENFEVIKKLWYKKLHSSQWVGIDMTGASHEHISVSIRLVSYFFSVVCPLLI